MVVFLSVADDSYFFYKPGLGLILQYPFSDCKSGQIPKIEKRREKVILANLSLIRDGTKVLVEEKVGKGAEEIIFPGGHMEEHQPIVGPVIREI